MTGHPYITDEAVKAAAAAARCNWAPAYKDHPNHRQCAQEGHCLTASELQLAAALPHIEKAIRADERAKIAAERDANRGWTDTEQAYSEGWCRGRIVGTEDTVADAAEGRGPAAAAAYRWAADDARSMPVPDAPLWLDNLADRADTGEPS